MQPHDAYYEQLLKTLDETSPRLVGMLRLAHRRRCLVLSDEGTPAIHLKGIEDLLVYLQRVDTALANLEESPRVLAARFLIQRAVADFETATEAVLSGFFGVTFEAMRDVMEISYLMRDFTHDPHSIEAWVNLPDRKRQQRFAAGVLRQRHADRLGIPSENLPDTGEYRLHSAFLHVDPQFPLPDIFVKGPPHKGQGPIGLIFAFGEILHHAAELLVPLYQLALLIAPGVGGLPSPQDAAPAFREAFLLSRKHTDLMVVAERTWRASHNKEKVTAAVAAAIQAQSEGSDEEGA